jgi:ASPIC and UnbV/FG-GAP-like repeat
MSAPALAAPGGPSISIRGRAYPVLLPRLSDPRLHLAAVIISLQVLGQVAFDFRLSIAQILVALGTCALLEVGIAFFRQHVLMWPASAMLTGNGVAFVLRVPGTEHGDWWSLHGWWIFAGTSAISLLSKYAIKFRGSHIFNPSNFGLVLCFLLLGPEHAEPLDFWWGPMSPWMALALAIIVGGGLAILIRIHLIVIAVAFWITFAAALAVLMAFGHAFTARWHLGPVSGHYFWWVLVTSPEVLVFLFFMITDPKTTPKSTRGRVVYAVSIGLLGVLLIAPAKTEFWAKVALLGALAIVCAARPLLTLVPRIHLDRRILVALGAVALVAYTGAIAGAGIRARSASGVPTLTGTDRLPEIQIGTSKGVQTKLRPARARQIAADLVADLQTQTAALIRRRPGVLARASIGDELNALTRQIDTARGGPIEVPAYRVDQMHVHLEPGHGQGGAIAVARLAGSMQLASYAGSAGTLVRREAPTPLNETLELQAGPKGRWLVAHVPSGRPIAVIPPAKTSPALLAAAAKAFAGIRLTDVARKAGVNFRQGDFRFGTTYDVHSMMGGGLCWLDYNDDGRLDLFVVNSYSDADASQWKAKGGLPRSALFENIGGGRFADVSGRSHANPAVQGNGCVAGDLNGDGHTDLLVTTNTYNVLLWNNGNGTFTDGTHAAGVDAFGTYGWHTGAAVADVNGDGRPDIFVSGYADVNAPSKEPAGFPLNFQAFRNLLYLNEGPDSHGHSRFKDVALKAGIETDHVDHSLGAMFTDVNGDGRPDLYVANDLDPNRLYVNESGGPLGFHFVEQGAEAGVADPNAGMGVAAQDYSGDSRPDIFVTNSRGQGHAAFQSTPGSTFSNVRSVFAPAVGLATGWGDTWVDLTNDGALDLVLANGAIPITNLKKDAAALQILANVKGRFANVSPSVGIRSGPLVNGRGVAAADYDNDGRMDVAVNSIGGKLILLRNTGGSGHWLEVSLAKFAPGALVTAVLPDGTRLVHEIQAGSSYLSSEDPRVHFGLGRDTRVKELIVRWPDERVTRRQHVASDQVVVAP